MSNFRRYYIPNALIFITNVTHNRQPFFREEANLDVLFSTMRKAQSIHAFHLLAYAILPDPMHLLMRTEVNTNFSQVMHSIKRNFTLNYKQENRVCTPITIWQPKFWDHIIRDEDDLARHIDYIHYNAVKHGPVAAPDDWKHSRYLFWKEHGYYSDQWGTQEPPTIGDMNIE